MCLLEGYLVKTRNCNICSVLDQSMPTCFNVVVFYFVLYFELHREWAGCLLYALYDLFCTNW